MAVAAWVNKPAFAKILDT